MTSGHSQETGRKRRGVRTPAYDVYQPACPTRQVLDRLADKWAVLILGRLDGEPVRFNQLRRDIAGISQKVLSRTLKNLERDGLVARTAFPTVPVTVEYAITPLGLTLQDTLQALAKWAESHMDTVLAAQRLYDRGVPPGTTGRRDKEKGARESPPTRPKSQRPRDD